MNPNKVVRDQVKALTDLPNVGPATVENLHAVGVYTPADLIGKSPYFLFEELCAVTGHRHDPCVVDVLISVVCFMNGGDPKPWWKYTEERKRYLSEQANA